VRAITRDSTSLQLVSVKLQKKRASPFPAIPTSLRFRHKWFFASTTVPVGVYQVLVLPFHALLRYVSLTLHLFHDTFSADRWIRFPAEAAATVVYWSASVKPTRN
jgi:hypothetical protein